MTQHEIDKLNKRFGAKVRIGFRLDSCGFPVAALVCKYGSAEISLYGAQVMTYRPVGHGPVLFLSKKSEFAEGKPIRGGIPICWPWFGKSKTDSSLPSHGFARTSLWQVVSSSYSDEVVELTLGLVDTPESKAIFPYAFAAQLRITVSQSLKLQLTTRNAGIAPMSLTEAFHPYFRVMRATNIAIQDLDGAKVDDRVTGEQSIQQGEVRITGETDRIYFPKQAHAAIADASLNRTIDIVFNGTKSLVVWNPWIEKSQQMPDFGDDEYTQMVCVEPANTDLTPLTLKPGDRHTLEMTIQAKLN
ncbi:MAG: D-hexose-6-phosphate mutarotase [Kiritimatiellae bacterium]|nr:D-hexose-6-phosphate mutarotase [Kiritimatiellia bacterium]